MAYVITGSPGTGKHTISGMLSSVMGLPMLDISGEADRMGLLQDGEVDVHTMLRRLRPPARCILAGHLAPQVVDKSFVDRAVVLRRSPYELEAVYQSREYARPKMLENLGAEILGVVAREAYDAFGDKMIQIDTTGMTIRDTCRRVMRALSDQHTGDAVDWLELVSKNHDMRRFFEY